MGVQKITKAITSKVYWEFMRKYMQGFVQSCALCQRRSARVQSHLRPLNPQSERNNDGQVSPWTSLHRLHSHLEFTAAFQSQSIDFQK